MRVHLLNSAMMPVEGIYTMRKINREEFKALLTKAYEDGKLISYIGYEQNIKLIAEWCDIRLQTNRSEVSDLKNGDILLIMKLKYRLNMPKLKSDQKFQDNIDQNDFEFFIAEFRNLR